MALANLIGSVFPSVPNAPGVPAVLRTIGSVNTKVVGLVADVALVLNALSPPRWGIYSSAGKAVVTADSVIALDLRKEFRIADFPVEQGGFASYNKVETPFDVKITFAQSGSVAARTALLASVDRAINTLDLYSVVTPEATYQSLNVVHYDYRRQSREGASLLQVDVWLQQVRIVKAAATTQVADPASAAPVSQGTVAAQPPTAAQGGAPPVPPGEGGSPQQFATYFADSHAYHAAHPAI